MPLARELKQEIVTGYATKDGDTGSPEVQVALLTERIKDLTGSQSENVFVPYDQVYGQGIEDTLHREPAIEKIGSAIGWAPTRNLEDILRDVIEHSRRAPVLPEAEPVTAP